MDIKSIINKLRAHGLSHTSLLLKCCAWAELGVNTLLKIVSICSSVPIWYDVASAFLSSIFECAHLL